MNTKERAIGIDVAKDAFVAAFDDTHVQNFSNTEDGVREFLSCARAYGHTQDSPVGMEPTGVYHLALALCLKDREWKPVIINPLVVHRYAGLSLRKTKTDKKDAFLVRKALLAGEGYLFGDTHESIALKSLVSERNSLVAMRRQVKARIHAQKVRSGATDALTGDLLSPVLKTLKHEIKRAEREMSQYESDTQELLRSIPGIGVATAAQLVAHIGDINRFDHPDKLVAYIGLDPRVHESGTSIHGKGYISKRGNKTLRHLLYQCAFIAQRRDLEFKRYYAKKKSDGKHHIAILCALERKLIMRIWAVWKRGTPFDPNGRPTQG